MIRHRLARFVGLGIVVLGCKPEAHVSVPSRPKKTDAQVDCQQAAKFREQAIQFRSSGRLARAQLFDERAHALCNSLPQPAPAGDPQRARQRRDGVWSWMARTEPLQSLRPERLSDPTMAAALDETVLGLNQGAALIVEPILAPLPFVFDATASKDWAWMSDRSLGKVGEWFERFVIPDREDDRRALIGPFADRIVFCFSRDVPGASATAFDVVDGKVIMQVALRGEPLRLDDSHFALAVGHAASECSPEDAYKKPCESDQAVEIWQAWPPKRVARFGPPEAKNFARAERVVTTPLPNQRSGPPKDKMDDPDRVPLSYAPTGMSPLQLRGPKSSYIEILDGLSDLGHGMLSANWRGWTSVIDWKSLSVLGGFLSLSDLGGLAISNTGRYIAYTSGDQDVGLFDCKTRKSRILLAPASMPQGTPIFSPDEHWLVTGGWWDFGFLWDTATGHLVRTLPSPVPFKPIFEDTGTVEPLGFIHSGKEVLFVPSGGAGLHRYEVPSGRELALPGELECVDGTSLRVTMLKRSDGTAAILGNKGRHYELGSGSIMAVHECFEGDATIIDAANTSGEAYLRRVYPPMVGATMGTEYQLQWISSRDGKVIAEWPAGGSEDYKITNDEHFAFSYAGPVRSLVDGREV